MTRPASMPFLTLGIIFLAIGITGQRNLRAVGIVFLVIGIAFLVRERRAGGPKRG